AGPRLGCWAPERGGGVDISIAVGQHSVRSRQRGDNGCRRRALAERLVTGLGRRKKQPVEDVLEFGAEEEIEPAFPAEPEIPAEAHRLGGLPLPAVVAIERSRSA